MSGVGRESLGPHLSIWYCGIAHFSAPASCQMELLYQLHIALGGLRKHALLYVWGMSRGSSKFSMEKEMGNGLCLEQEEDLA